MSQDKFDDPCATRVIKFDDLGATRVIKFDDLDGTRVIKFELKRLADGLVFQARRARLVFGVYNCHIGCGTRAIQRPSIVLTCVWRMSLRSRMGAHGWHSGVLIPC